ncbi:MAG: EamA family transporter [Acidobacteriota bacterium]
MKHPAPASSAVIAAFATVYIVWGSTYLAIRFAIETMPPFSMAGVRFLVAGSLLYAWTYLRGAPRPTAVQWRSAAIIGTFLLLGGNGLVSWAEQYVPSGVTALIVATVSLWMVALEALRPGGTRPGARTLVGLALGMVGIAVLVGPAQLGGEPVDLVGAIALVAASLLWAIGSIYSRGAPQTRSTLQNVAMQMLAGGAGLMVVGLGLGERLDPSMVSTKSAVALAYLIAIGGILGYSAYVWLLEVSTPAKVSTYAYVNPVVAVLLGWLLADESIGPRVLAAAAMVIAAVVLITTARQAAPSPTTDDGPTEDAEIEAASFDQPSEIAVATASGSHGRH